MKKVLSLLMFTMLVSLLSAQFQCPVDYRINNGGGNCPDTVINGITLSATGSLDLLFTIPIPVPPVITGVIELLTTGDTVITGIMFGHGTITTNNNIRYCYYPGPNNNNNLQGDSRRFRFIVLYNSSPCSQQGPLPTSFTLFTLARNNSDVVMKWEIATEAGDGNFRVEHNAGGIWKQVGIIPPQAANGSISRYQYTHLNNANVPTQYRITQVNTEGYIKMSEVRIVRGKGQKNQVMIYPVPSNNGVINVIFDDAHSHHLRLTSSDGKLLKEWNTVSNSTQITLGKGVYFLQITTNQQITKKIVVAL